LITVLAGQTSGGSPLYVRRFLARQARGRSAVLADGTSIAIIVSTPNLDEDRYMASLEVVDIATGKMTTIVDGAKAISVSFERWAPNGQSTRVPGQRADERRAQAAGIRSAGKGRRLTTSDDRAVGRAAARLVTGQQDAWLRHGG
jgi:hypothetical protein